MEDAFEHAMMEAREPAAEGFVRDLKRTMAHVREHHPQTQQAVDSCLRGLEGAPTMLHVLVAAYVLNGGIPIKFDLGHASESDSDADLDRFLSEISIQEEDSLKAAVQLEAEPAPGGL